jgi:RNA polymerase sigma factor (sigma-70 family)
MDESALVAVYERYHQQLYRFCFSIVGNADDAQDALQNTMVKALRALPGEQRQIELKPWLYRIAHNESIDLLRKRRGEAQIEPELLVSASNPEETAATKERLRHLLADLASLPERQRKALVMRELAGLDFAEIGETFGTSPEVARQTVYEARINLRQLEAGREMSCTEVMRQTSDGDGRVLRRREIQAHLRACAECRAFHEAIESRQRDLAAIAPLPAVAAAGILQSLLAGAAGSGLAGAGAAGAVGAGAGKVLATSAVVKSVATVAVVGAIGVGAADRGGLIDAGLPGGDGGQTKERTLRQAPGAPGTAASPAVRQARVSSEQAARTGRVDGQEKRTVGQGRPQAATHGAGSKPSPSTESAPKSLPAAANHGQEVAASHGGGRTHGQSRSQSKGTPSRSKGGPRGASNPSHPASSPKPSASKPAKPKPAVPQPNKVAPDVPPEPSFKPSQPPKSQGETGAAGNPSSKEAR